MAFCTNCGVAHQEGMNFCGNCGLKIDATKSGHESAPVPASSPVANSTHEEVVLWEGKPSGISDRIKEAAHVNSTTYKVTNQRIIVRSGLIGKKVEEIELLGVKDISVEQSLGDRLLGVGSITILSLDKTNPVLVLDDVKDVQEVKDIIRHAVREEKAAQNTTYRENI